MSAVNKILYQPMSIVISIGAGVVAAKSVDAIWERIEPGSDGRPLPGDEAASTTKVVVGAVIAASTLAATRVVLDRQGRRFYKHLTGFWPGEPKPHPVRAPAPALDGP